MGEVCVVGFLEERQDLLQQKGTGHEDEDEDEKAAGLCGDAGACVVLMGSSRRLAAQAFGLSFHICDMGLALT